MTLTDEQQQAAHTLVAESYAKHNPTNRTLEQCYQQFLSTLSTWPGATEYLASLVRVHRARQRGNYAGLPVAEALEAITPVREMPTMTSADAAVDAIGARG